MIKVYDLTGKEVKIIENRVRTAGTYTVMFDANQLASGVYFYKLSANNYSATKKFILMK